MKNTLRMLRVVGLTMVLMLAGCGGQQGASGGGDGEPGGGEKPKEYVIGAIVSKTGPASPLGEPEYNTLKLLEKKLNESGGINGVPLRLVLVDDESEPQKAQQEMNRMIHDEKVLAVIGSTTTGASLAMKGIAQENQVPLVSLAASVKVVEPPNEWVFKTPHSDELAAARIWQYLKDKGLTKVAIVHDSNAYGTAGKEALVKLAKDFGIAIVTTESYNTKDQDMTVQLTKVKNAGAQAMVVWGTNPGPAIIAKNRKDLGLTIPYISSHGSAFNTFIQLAGDAAEGVVLPTGRLLVAEQIPDSDPQAKVVREFYQEYVQAYNSEPGNFAAYAYDAFHLIVDALKNGATTREAIRDHLEKTTNWVGTTGVFNFSPEDHNGLTTDAMVMAEVKGSKWVYKQD